MSRSRARLDALERRTRKATAAKEMPSLAVPANIIDFATSPAFLGVALYPRQACLLKVITQATELLTPADLEFLHQESEGFELVRDDRGARYEGAHGLPPDLFDRIAWCAKHGLSGFDEVALVIGRRGSKTLLIAILIAWRVYRLLLLNDPQAHYGASKKGCSRKGAPSVHETPLSSVFGGVSVFLGAASGPVVSVGQPREATGGQTDASEPPRRAVSSHAFQMARSSRVVRGRARR